MEQILGWLSLLFIFIFVILFTRKNPEAKNFLLIAFLLRSLCVIISEYGLFILPDSQDDAYTFEIQAREFSRNYGYKIFYQFHHLDSLLISRIISIFYTLFGESKMMAQTISVALGTASVYLVYYLTMMLWDAHVAKKAAWVTTLFPTLVLYSSLTLREVYIVFFLLVGLIGIEKFIKSNSVNSFLQIILSFYILIYFHGAVAFGGLIFLLYLSLKLVKKQLVQLNKLKMNINSFIFVCLLSVPIILFLIDRFNIPYLPSVYDLTFVLFEANISNTNTTSYPDWLKINSFIDLFIKMIPRFLYFLYSPFIWNIKSLYHVVGLLDGILYFIMTIYIIKNWHSIWANPASRFFLVLFIVYAIIHGLGVGNFGTGIRHRSKFVVILIILAAPKIHKFIFSNNKKLYKN